VIAKYPSFNKKERTMNRDSAFGELVAEFLGTAILILLGDGVVANVVFGTRLAGLAGASYGNWNTIAFGWGMAVAIAVYVAGGVTGAHINPAVTLAAVVRRDMPFGKAIGWMIAQVAGAFVGAFLVWVMYQGSFAAGGYANVFYTAPASADYGVINCLLSEIIGTAMLLAGIYGIVDAKNVGVGANLWPFMVGILVLAIGLSLGMPSGYAINPARDFGPRLFANLLPGGAADAWSAPASFNGIPYFWVPIVGPFIGGPLGAWIYDLTIQPYLAIEEPPEGAEEM
jgi:glycerol uptake facilitator protein